MKNIEWAQQQMRAKTASYTPSKEAGDGADWRDRCGAIAAIPDRYAKALACIVIWPSGNWTAEYRIVCEGLRDVMLSACRADKRQGPRGDGAIPLQVLALHMAEMVTHLQLYDLWEHYTMKGRLNFAGIEIQVGAYRKVWYGYEQLMLTTYDYWLAVADAEIGTYRKKMLERD